MQGPNHLDLAKTLADEHYRSVADHNTPVPQTAADKMRQWMGHRLISIGERLTARPTELQLSTGPPCP